MGYKDEESDYAKIKDKTYCGAADKSNFYREIVKEDVQCRASQDKKVPKKEEKT